jgi:hypothetical protein
MIGHGQIEGGPAEQAAEVGVRVAVAAQISDRHKGAGGRGVDVCETEEHSGVVFDGAGEGDQAVPVVEEDGGQVDDETSQLGGTETPPVGKTFPTFS